jgi:hypothetical protein
MTRGDQWTPKLVGERLVAAVRWAQYAAGPTGPAGFRSNLPAVALSWEDRLAEGWGLPDGPDEEEERLAQKRLKIAVTPAQITQHLAALEWPATYLLPDRAGDARVLNLWVRCKVLHRPFNEAIDRRKYLTRSAAYRMRDRALSVISVGLDRQGVPL